MKSKTQTRKQPCIACLMAHADDIELCCGGLLAKFIDNGYKGIYGVLSLCNSGYVNIDRKGEYRPSLTVTPQRHKEAEAAAQVFGAEFFKMDLMENCFTDLKGNIVPLAYTQERSYYKDAPQGGLPLASAAGSGQAKESALIIQKLADLLIENQPSIVIGQTIDDSNPDHFCAAMIVRKAYVIASRVVKMGPYYVCHSNHSFLPIEPTWIADVTGYECVAERAIACHVSQGGTQRLPSMRSCWRKWGRRIHVKSAEPFVRVL